MIGVREPLLQWRHKAGLDLETMLKSVAPACGGKLSPTIWPAHHAEQFRPRIFRRALHQGHGHRAGRSEAMNLSLPGLALSSQLWSIGAGQRLGP
jgi:hypothetical protein